MKWCVESLEDAWNYDSYVFSSLLVFGVIHALNVVGRNYQWNYLLCVWYCILPYDRSLRLLIHEAEDVNCQFLQVSHSSQPPNTINDHAEKQHNADLTKKNKVFEQFPVAVLINEVVLVILSVDTVVVLAVPLIVVPPTALVVIVVPTAPVVVVEVPPVAVVPLAPVVVAVLPAVVVVVVLVQPTV
ncbi:unnamed protein product, partial [Rotaria socialis]